VLLVAALAACEDSPTVPGVYTQSADGHLWVALDMPFGTPTLRTWLPFVRPDPPSTDAVMAGLRELRNDAEQLRRTGAIDEAIARETEAAVLAAGSLTRNPPSHVLLTALAALDVWCDKADGVVEWGQFAEMRAAADAVRSRRTAAAEALERGDTSAAAVDLAIAGGVVSSMAPAAVASRLLVHAEQRLVERAASEADAARALRLLRHAREALANGDEVRALRRALYALQLADGNGAPAPPADLLDDGP
jgi:hypothetical protein